MLKKTKKFTLGLKILRFFLIPILLVSTSFLPEQNAKAISQRLQVLPKDVAAAAPAGGPEKLCQCEPKRQLHCQT